MPPRIRITSDDIRKDKNGYRIGARVRNGGHNTGPNVGKYKRENGYTHLGNRINAGYNTLKGIIDSDYNKQLVQHLSGLGLTNDDIRFLIVNPDTGKFVDDVTFRKYFAEDLEVGRASMKLKMSQQVLKSALGSPAEYDEHGKLIKPALIPYFPAMQWWEKTRSGFKESNPLNVPEGTKVTLIIEG